MELSCWILRQRSRLKGWDLDAGKSVQNIAKVNGAAVVTLLPGYDKAVAVIALGATCGS